MYSPFDLNCDNAGGIVLEAYMKYRQIPVMGTNCYLFWDELTMNAVCIDPGFAGRRIAREIQLMGLKLYCIFLTHAHADHVSGIDDMCMELDEFPSIYMSKNELMYEDFPFKKQWGCSCVKRFWEEYKKIVIDSMEFEVIPAPGHSPGAVCIAVDDYIISGDLVTNESIGRTDFIGCDVNNMFLSLKKVLLLPDSLKILPGHDVITSIEIIKTKNPYAKQILQR